MRTTRDFPLEIKEFEGESGVFTGLASVYDVVDLTGDVVERGAFSKTLQVRRNEVPVLWQHRSDEPIGLGRLEDTPKGLLIRGKLSLASDVARKAHGLLLDGVLKGLSIGYEVIRDEVRGNIRHLKEIRLWEVSLCTFPANPEAVVSNVKTDTNTKPEELKALFERYRIESKGFNL